MTVIEDARGTLMTLLGDGSVAEADLANIRDLIAECDRLTAALDREVEARIRRMTTDQRIAHNAIIRAEAAEAEVARLTAPPTPDEREAVRRVVSNSLMEDWAGSRQEADRVSAWIANDLVDAGFRRWVSVT